jgi:hypothetical protein
MSASSFATQTLTHKTLQAVKYVTSLYVPKHAQHVVKNVGSSREKAEVELLTRDRKGSAARHRADWRP